MNSRNAPRVVDAADAHAAGAAAAPYWSHLDRVERWVRRMVGPWLEPDDLVQEVMLVACRQWPGFRHESGIATWLFGITRKVTSRALRRQRLRRWWTGFAGQQIAPEAQLEPSEELERRQAVAQLYRALERLPERYRVPVILFELEAHSTQEIALLLALSPEAARMRLHRGRKLLLAALNRLMQEER